MWAYCWFNHKRMQLEFEQFRAASKSNRSMSPAGSRALGQRDQICAAILLRIETGLYKKGEMYCLVIHHMQNIPDSAPGIFSEYVSPLIRFQKACFHLRELLLITVGSRYHSVLNSRQFWPIYTIWDQGIWNTGPCITFNLGSCPVYSASWRLKSLGWWALEGRAFLVAVPQLWNAFLWDACLAPSVKSFRHQLKFRWAF